MPSFLGAKSVDAQRLLLCLVGTGTVVLVGFLGRRVIGPLVGVIAAAIAALYPMLFLAEATLMAEPVYVLLVTAALLLAYRAADAPSPLRFAALGAVIGLSALTRAEGLFFAVVLLIPLVISLRSLATKRRALLALIAIGTAILVVVPWTIRNAVQLHAFVPISNNIGTAVDGANCDLTYSVRKSRCGGRRSLNSASQRVAGRRRRRASRGSTSNDTTSRRPTSRTGIAPTGSPTPAPTSRGRRSSSAPASCARGGCTHPASRSTSSRSRVAPSAGRRWGPSCTGCSSPSL